MLFGLVIVLPASGGHLAAISLLSRVSDFAWQTIRLQEFHHVGAFPNNPGAGVINGSTWSIPYEFWCYIGVALLGICGVLRSNRVLLVLFGCSMTVGYLFDVFRWTPGGSRLPSVIFGYPPFWARLLPMYLVGVVFYRRRSHLLMKASWIFVACGSLVAAAIVPHGWPLFFPVAGAYLLLVVAFHPAIRLHGWSRFGDFSYGTYLYAFPVQQMIMRSIGHPVSPWKLFVLATPVTLLCAVVSWHAVEKWFLRAVRRTTFEPRAVETGQAHRLINDRQKNAVDEGILID